MAIQDAHATYQAFFDAFNARDSAAWARLLHFPHLRAGPDGVTIWDAPAHDAALRQWQALSAAGWQRSDPDEPVLLKLGEHSIHLAGGWQSLATDGSVLDSNQVCYLLTCVDGQWAVQARFAAGPPASEPAVDAVRSCATAFIAALRLGDGDAAAAQATFPFVDLRPGDLATYSDATGLATLLGQEDANDISGARIDVVHCGNQAATLAVELDRNDGRALEHTLLHLAMVDGSWRIQARSRLVIGGQG